MTFPRPGALHKARWKAKLLYTLKLALMEQHFCFPQGTITTRQQVAEDSGICHFHSHIYAKWWLTCEKAVDAAWNDLTLYHHLQAYKAVDEDIAASAIKALERQCWYLTGEMLPWLSPAARCPMMTSVHLPERSWSTSPLISTCTSLSSALALALASQSSPPSCQPPAWLTLPIRIAGLGCTSCTLIQNLCLSM